MIGGQVGPVQRLNRIFLDALAIAVAEGKRELRRDVAQRGFGGQFVQ